MPARRSAYPSRIIPVVNPSMTEPYGHFLDSYIKEDYLLIKIDRTVRSCGKRQPRMSKPMVKEPERRDAPRAARDERRDAIVAIAHEVFLANGYAGTSMSAIAAKLGGSKGTLYNYFSSKEELFTAVIERKSEQLLSFLYDAEIEGGGDLRSTLTQFGRRFLELVLAEDSIATYRLVTAECARFPEIGHTLYKIGPQRGREHMSRFLARAKDAGQLRHDADVDLAAEQICALCLSGIQQRRLWMVTPMPSQEEIRAQAEGAVSTFLRAFGA